ncbi:hypothetical protein MMC29_007280 [Sticta canariensis]|nr:hypothetical protein [Sticta canariensis]
MTHLPASYFQAKRNIFTLDQIEQATDDNTKALFVYGSLMFPGLAVRRIMDTVADEDEHNFIRRMTPAFITHHTRLAVKDTPFCALVDQGTADDKVEGLVIFGITAEEIGRIDRYEGGMYSREEVDVVIPAYERPDLTGHMLVECKAWTYIWAGWGDQLVPASEAEWRREDFILTPEYRALADDLDRFDESPDEEPDFETSTTPPGSPPTSARHRH